MSNYLLEIETEFSRGRGKPSRLSPMDWQLAAAWEDTGIPLHVVLGALEDTFKKHAAQPQKRPINSLRYFESAVEERFDQWKSNQIGKSPAVSRKLPDSEEIMKDLPIAVQTAQIDENAKILTDLADALPQDDLPEPLAAAIKHLRGELLALADDATSKNLSSDAIETRLSELCAAFEPSLIVSVSEADRAQIIADTRREFGKFNLLPDKQHKVLIRKLYAKFGLPELTLFAF